MSEGQRMASAEAVRAKDGSPKPAVEILPQSTPAKPLPAHLLARVLVLGLLLCVIHFWFQHHLRVAFWQEATGLVVFGIFSTLGGKLLPVFGKPGERLWQDGLRRLGAVAVDTRFLVLLGLLVLVLGCSWSSVTVVAAGAAGPLTLTVQADGQSQGPAKVKSLAGPDAVARFLRFTTPFGQPYFLQAEGYQRYSFTLYPWVGATIRVADQLVPAPSLLLRVPTSRTSALPGGRIELLEIVEGRELPLGECATERDRASVIFGRELSPTDRHFQRWDIELTAAGFDPAHRSQTLLNWQRPLPGALARELRPGMLVVANFRAGGGAVLASRQFRLSADMLQDVALMPARPATATSP